MDIREIEYIWNDEKTRTHTADVVVGDGTKRYDENFDDYDDRIFFYFENEEEFQLTLAEGTEEFTIVRVL